MSVPGQGPADEPELFAAVILFGQASPSAGQDGVDQHRYVSVTGHQHAPDARSRRGDGPAHVDTGTVRKIIVKDDQLRTKGRDPPDCFARGP
jgi:hypothetical protein